jgi:hypothetical protein
MESELPVIKELLSFEGHAYLDDTDLTQDFQLATPV